MTVFHLFFPLLVVIKEDTQRALAGNVRQELLMAWWLVLFCVSCRDIGQSDDPLFADQEGA